jgi:phosphatidylinositol 4-kinase A
VIGLLKDAWRKAGLELYLAPYGVIPTGYECGIIEVVPRCKSRSALGETTDGGLYDIWRREFGAPGSPRFEAARHNFIISEAGSDPPKAVVASCSSLWAGQM